MDPLTVGLIGAGVSGLGNVVGNIIGSSGEVEAQEKANEANAKMAKEQMAFQERMSSSAYQRQADDMRLAGINPRVQLGGGSSTPQGAIADIKAVNTKKALASGLTSATDAARFAGELANQTSSTNLNTAAAAAKESEISLNEANAENARANALNATARTLNEQLEARTRNIKLPQLAAEAKSNKEQAEWNSYAMGWDNVVKRAGEILGGISDAASLWRIGTNLGKGLGQRPPAGGGPKLKNIRAIPSFGQGITKPTNGERAAYQQGLTRGQKIIRGIPVNVAPGSKTPNARFEDWTKGKK